MSDLEVGQKVPLRLWVFGAVGALLLHVGGAALAIANLQTDEPQNSIGDTGIEVGFEQAAAQREQTDLPPGPDSDASQASPQLAEQKAELEIQISELTVANVRRDAAEAAGLAPKFVKFITAAEPDEALAQAKELAKELKPPADTAANGRPADLRQGSRGSTKPTSESRDDLVRRMAGF